MLGSLDQVAKEILGGNTEDGARADIVYQDCFKTSYLDICVISPVCDTHKSQPITSSMSKAERKKNLDYKERINKVLGAEFVPIVMTSGGCMSNSTKGLIKELGIKIATNNSTDPKDEMRMIKTEISMALMKARVHGLRLNKFKVAEQIRHNNQFP